MLSDVSGHMLGRYAPGRLVGIEMCVMGVG